MRKNSSTKQVEFTLLKNKKVPPVSPLLFCLTERKDAINGRPLKVPVKTKTFPYTQKDTCSLSVYFIHALALCYAIFVFRLCFVQSPIWF
jgi:hypothetical protein